MLKTNETELTPEVLDAIARLKKTREVHVSRGPLFEEYVRDYDRMIQRLESGLPLTNWQRGIPQ